jgi:RimJ/RimL family protein N-acetyltransferase
MIPGPAYRIITKRLVIRCYNPEDAPLVAASVTESLDHLKPWMPWAHSEPQENLQTRIERLRQFRGRFDQNQDYIYGIFDLEQTRLLGGTGLHTRAGDGALEIGYWIHKDFINQGLATESVSALTKIGFEINEVSRMEIHCDPANLRSAAIPRKLGYTHEATLRKHTRFLDGWRDSAVWTLFLEEYPKTPSKLIDIKAFDAANRRIL